MAVLDAVESAGRYIAAIHSFPSPANLTISFTRIPKFSSVPHRVPDLPAEGVPFDPGYVPGSHTRTFPSGSFQFELQAAAPTLLLQPVASSRALSI